MAKYLITHIDLDGKTAAIFTNVFNDYLGVDEIFFENYNFENLDRIKELITPENTIWIVDLSVSENTFLEWKSILKEIKIWDHHEPALVLNKYDDCIVDEDTRCGAKVYWEEKIRPLVAPHYPETAIAKADYLIDLTDTYDRWQYKPDPKKWKLAVSFFRVVMGFANLKDYKNTDYLANRLKDFLLKDTPLAFEDKEKEYITKKETDHQTTWDNFELKVLTDNKGYKFGIVPSLKTTSANLSLFIHDCFINNPEVDYIIGWPSTKNMMSFRTYRDDLNLNGLHGVFGHQKAAGARRSPNGSTKDPEIVYLREVMEKLLTGNYCCKWVEPGEEKSEKIELEEIK